MTRQIYINGNYVPEDQARISVMDRAFLFGDGIYEVIAVVGGHLVDAERHIARVFRSAAAIGIEVPLSHQGMSELANSIVSRNSLDEGVVYIQISRGTEEREFTYSGGLSPTLIAFTQKKELCTGKRLASGVSAVTIEDIRWKRRDIKSTSLLGQVLPKQFAKTNGCAEAIMYEDGFVTEGASTSVFIVDQNNELVTRQLSTEILPSVTRQAVLEIAGRKEVNFVERKFSLSEMLSAREVFLVGATFFVVPVVEIDGTRIAQGGTGEVTLEIQQEYIRLARSL